MSKKITKRGNSEKIARMLHDAGLDGMQVGDVYSTDGHGGDPAYHRVDKFVLRGKTLHIQHSIWRDGEWEEYSTSSTDDWTQYYNAIKLDRPIAQIEQEALDALQDVDALRPETTGVSTDTALVVAGSKQQVLAIQQAVKDKMEKVEVIRRAVEIKVRQLHDIVSTMQSQLTEIGKVVEALELYLGVREEIVLVCDGEFAPEDTPISIRQLTLYMDEEVGDANPNQRTGQRGIDFQSVEDFDAWLREDVAHLNIVMPEPKGIVAIRPTRQMREYYPDNPWIDSMIKENNLMTYLLIRNGDRVFRIWTDTKVGERLYPSAGEMELLFKEAEGYFGERDAKDKEFSYKKNALLLQGIVDRTDTLKPMSHLVNLFDPATYLGLVQFIRDAEPGLTAGHETYLEWKDRINAKIERGSRIFLAPVNWYKHSVESRFLRDYNKGCAPHAPGAGVYTVEDILPPGQYEHSNNLVIMYNPGDEVGTSGWVWNPHPRKNRLSFVVLPSDDFVLNYDLMDLESLEWFLVDRIERKHYLEMMPVLRGIRDERLKELEWEKHFVGLVASRLDVTEETVWEAVDWWKSKVIWKRPIRKDDSKALRMIEAKIKREIAEQ